MKFAGKLALVAAAAFGATLALGLVGMMVTPPDDRPGNRRKAARDD